MRLFRQLRKLNFFVSCIHSDIIKASMYSCTCTHCKYSASARTHAHTHTKNHFSVLNSVLLSLILYKLSYLIINLFQSHLLITHMHTYTHTHTHTHTHTLTLIQWDNSSVACSFYKPQDTGAVGNVTSCHDEVDFSLCFEDTAILYGICVTFWVLSGLSFCRGNGLRPKLDFGLLHASKLVRVVHISKIKMSFIQMSVHVCKYHRFC